MKPAEIITPDTAADTGRLAARFHALKQQNRCGFVTFLTAGDPDLATCASLLKALPAAGVDIIELGMPFSDPMADGVAIQLANLRAFKAGVTLKKVLQLVSDFRTTDADTPLVLMGYYNPIFTYGVEQFLKDAKAAGADGLIVVDLPPEEDGEWLQPARKAGLNIIRLITPTTDAKRLPKTLHNASGFLYYVSVTGITGGKTANADTVRDAITALRPHTTLPIAAGFGISTPEQAKTMAQTADAVVVGSAIVTRIKDNLDTEGNAKPILVKDVLKFVSELAQAVHHG